MLEFSFGSLFSGVGGIDLGLERAAWMTRHLEYVLETGHLCAADSECAVCGPLRGGGESV